ncbi:MAG: hypothetical protein CMJ18_11605 [Phycisphaeraceae bacterium]|nr:hypothetical protein [Phycisphaeraceae bacterium]
MLQCDSPRHGGVLSGIIVVAACAAHASGVGVALESTGGSVNPANWTFFVETTGNDASWTSPPGQNVETGFPFYAFESEITQLDIDVDTPIIGVQTLDKNDLIDFGVITAEQLLGSDTLPGPLPITITDQAFDEPGIISANVFVGVNADGQGTASITNVSFGSLPLLGPIVAVRVGGTVMVEGVIPEPATVALFAGAGVAGLTRRARRVRASSAADSSPVQP